MKCEGDLGGVLPQLSAAIEASTQMLLNNPPVDVIVLHPQEPTSRLSPSNWTGPCITSPRYWRRWGGSCSCPNRSVLDCPPRRVSFWTVSAPNFWPRAYLGPQFQARAKRLILGCKGFAEKAAGESSPKTERTEVYFQFIFLPIFTKIPETREKMHKYLD